MKTIQHLLPGLLLAAALSLGWTTAVQGQEPIKGAQRLMEFKPIKTPKDLEGLEPGDMVAMACPKCKDVVVSYVEKGVKRADAIEKHTLKHLCPGCETTIETKGVGKWAKDTVKHVCQKCGSKDVFCCVMKKGAGATPGMDEKKEK
jgi:DNA-directed RNA polymerase subunit M/transcription elongation factor TFIIS